MGAVYGLVMYGPFILVHERLHDLMRLTSTDLYPWMRICLRQLWARAHLNMMSAIRAALEITSSTVSLLDTAASYNILLAFQAFQIQIMST